MTIFFFIAFALGCWTIGASLPALFNDELLPRYLAWNLLVAGGLLVAVSITAGGAQ